MPARCRGANFPDWLVRMLALVDSSAASIVPQLGREDAVRQQPHARNRLA